MLDPAIFKTSVVLLTIQSKQPPSFLIHLTFQLFLFIYPISPGGGNRVLPLPSFASSPPLTMGTLQY